jgi:hypothetical protein
MTDSPILFSTPMVRAIQRDIDPKTQTRRPVKPQPFSQPEINDETGLFDVYAGGDVSDSIRSPYGVAGDRLWVKETFVAFGRWETRFNTKKGRDEWHFIDMTLECDRAYQYGADDPDVPLADGRGALPGWHRRPSIFMPRTASRITLEITDVRVERLQSISEADAIAEGIYLFPGDGGGFKAARGQQEYDTAVEAYRHLWDGLNVERGFGWDANPWVWVVAFDRLTTV